MTTSDESWSDDDNQDGLVPTLPYDCDAATHRQGTQLHYEQLSDLVVPGFEIICELGRGGMGVVYKARQHKLDRIVALKMILAGIHAGREQMARFRREAEAVAQLKHPNIVTIYETGEVNGLLYYAFELVEGHTLAQHIADTEIAPREAVRMVQLLARAIHVVHGSGIIHRDLKPSNILLTLDGTPKITDFGLAKRIDSGEEATRSGAVLGTANYMAPEQAAGDSRLVEPMADVYALGAILYELVAGRPPFQSDNNVDTILKVLSEEPVSPCRHRPGLSADVGTICLKCLQKAPGKRYQTGEELAADLGRYLNNEPVQARPANYWERTLKWARRNPALATLVTFCVAVVLFVSTGGWWYGLQLKTANKKAEDRLYLSLVAEAGAIRRAREAGYREDAWLLLQEALELDPPDDERFLMRQEAVACMGDFVGIAPMSWGGFDSPWRWNDRLLMELHPHSDILAIVLESGAVSLRKAMTGVELQLLSDTESATTALCFSEDGEVLATGTSDGHIHLWSRNDDHAWVCNTTLSVPGDSSLSEASPLSAVSAVAMSRDGERVACCTVDNADVFVWRVGDEPSESVYQGLDGASLHCLAFRPDGSHLLAGFQQEQSNGALVWDTTNGKRTRHVMSSLDRPREIVFSPDGKLVVTACGDDGVHIYDADTYQQRLFVGGDFPFKVSFSGNSQVLAIPAYQKGTVRLLNIANNRELATLKLSNRAQWVEFARDGQSLLAASENAVDVWDLTRTKEKQILDGHAGGVPGVAFDPGGEILASVGKDRTVKFWQVSTGQLIGTIPGFNESVQAVAFSPDGDLIATGDWDGGVRLWDTTDYSEVDVLAHPLGQRVWSVAFSPNGEFFAASVGREGRGGVLVWRIERSTDKGASRYRFELHQQPVDFPSVSLCFSPDSHLLASVDDTDAPLHQIHVWDLTRECRVPCVWGQSIESILGVGFLPDSEHLAFVGPERLPELWNIGNGTNVFDAQQRIPGRHVGIQARGAVAVHSDGKYLAQESLGVRIWDLDSQSLAVVLPEESGSLWCFAWSPVDYSLAVGYSDGTIVIWHLDEVRSKLREIGLDW